MAVGQACVLYHFFSMVATACDSAVPGASLGVGAIDFWLTPGGTLAWISGAADKLRSLEVEHSPNRRHDQQTPPADKEVQPGRF